MFDFIRTHQRLMQFILLILILPSFALIGVSGYTNYVSGDRDLVKVGSGAITQQTFDQARNSQLQQMQQNSSGGFDPSVLDTRRAGRLWTSSLIASC
jgi:peptidyl-prolyl cis-trans isomerase D